MPTTFDTLAAWAADLSAADVPAPTRRRAKLRMLDCVGSLIWAANRGFGHAQFAAFAPLGGAEQSVAVGRGRRMPAPFAAGVNASAASTMCETDRFSDSHPAVVLVPTVLAVGEAVHASGETMLEALLIGYEVLGRIAAAVPVMSRGFDPTAAIGPIGGAAAAAHLLGLSVERGAAAMALAGSTGGGVLAAYGNLEGAKAQFGHAAMAGVIAALLADAGAAVDRALLEGGAVRGVPGLAASLSDMSDLPGIAAGLGDTYVVDRIGAKRHEGCRYTNAGADAVLDLVATSGLRPQDVAAIDVATFAKALEVRVEDPQTPTDAIFNMEFVVATALIAGDVSVNRFDAATLADPAIRAMMGRITVRVDAALEAAHPGRWPLRMTVQTYSGATLERLLEFPQGEPENPFPEQVSLERFHTMAGPYVGESNAARIAAMVLDIDTLSDSAELAHLLAQGAPVLAVP